jgi:hypothetical protein
MTTIARTLGLVLVACTVMSAAPAQTVPLPPSWMLTSKVLGQPSVITYLHNGDRRIYAFVAAPDGNLKVRYLSGTIWHWSNLGRPAGAEAITDPAAITFVDANNIRKIYVFAIQIGGRQDRQLVVAYWNGREWNWLAVEGGPPLTGGTALTALSPVTFATANGTQIIYVFAENSTNGHLVAHVWTGSAWVIQDHGLPPGGGSPLTVSHRQAVTYPGSMGQVIDVFCSASGVFGSQQLSLRRLSFVYWSWHNQGGPVLPGFVSAVTFPYVNGTRIIHAFVAPADNRPATFNPVDLQVNSWSGSQWHWANHGGPFGSPNAITFLSGGSRRIYVFGLYSVHLPGEAPPYDYVDRLRVRYWNGAGWFTADQGTITGPAGSIGAPAAISYLDTNNTRRIEVFAGMRNAVVDPASLRHLVSNSWDGSSWSWVAHGLF